MTNNPYQSPHEPGPPHQESNAASRLGWHLLAPLASCLGTAVLIVSLRHVHSDRTHRQPIVTYVGPLVTWMPELIYFGLALSLAGFLAGGYLVNRYQDEGLVIPPAFSATVAMMVASGNAIMSFIVWAAIWED